MLNSDNRDEITPAGKQKRELPLAAKRALHEADTRRKAAKKALSDQPAQKETGGREGPEPVRFGDWEVKGIASDF